MKTWLRGHSVTLDEVRGAFDAWSRSRAGKRHGGKVAQRHGSAEHLIAEIYLEIKTRNITFEPIRYFYRREKTNGKVRKIGIQSIKQQVCDYLCVRAMQPMLDARLGYYQCASVPGKGQVFAKRHLEEWYAEGGWFAKHDIRQCFPSMDRRVIAAFLEKHLGSADIRYTVAACMANYGGDGLNIGSYLSQYLANLVLSMAYHHVEGLHKVRRGKRRPLITHQLWYMDDLVMFSKSRRDLAMAMREVERFAAEELHLQVKPWKVCKCGVDPLDMVGFAMTGKGTKLRARIYLRSRRAFKRMGRAPCISRARRCVSYWGFLKHSDCGRYRAACRDVFDQSRRYVSAWERRHACNAPISPNASRYTSARTGKPRCGSGGTSAR